MASRLPNQPLLCENCHVKPRFGGFEFCSKTCGNIATVSAPPPPAFKVPASNPKAPNPIAATKFAHGPAPTFVHKPAQVSVSNICANCHKEPKFGRHDFCGKKCAAAAKAVAGSGTGPTASRKKHAGNRGALLKQPGVLDAAKALNGVATLVRGLSINTSNTASRKATAPTASSSDDDGESESESGDDGFRSRFHEVDSEDGYTSDEYATAPPPPRAKGVPRVDDEDVRGPVQATPFVVCQIPFCGRATAPNASYCSRQHSREAVASGLSKACIMCYIMPQSKVDFFCSVDCREDALHKVEAKV